MTFFWYPNAPREWWYSIGYLWFGGNRQTRFSSEWVLQRTPAETFTIWIFVVTDDSNWEQKRRLENCCVSFTVRLDKRSRQHGTFAQVFGSRDYSDTWSTDNNASVVLLTRVAQMEIVQPSKYVKLKGWLKYKKKCDNRLVGKIFSWWINGKNIRCRPRPATTSKPPGLDEGVPAASNSSPSSLRRNLHSISFTFTTEATS